MYIAIYFNPNTSPLVKCLKLSQCIVDKYNPSVYGDWRLAIARKTRQGLEGQPGLASPGLVLCWSAFCDSVFSPSFKHFANQLIVINP